MFSALYTSKGSIENYLFNKILVFSKHVFYTFIIYRLQYIHFTKHINTPFNINTFLISYTLYTMSQKKEILKSKKTLG